MGSLRVYCMEHRTAAAYEEHCVFAGFADRIFRGALASWGRLGAVLGLLGQLGTQDRPKKAQENPKTILSPFWGYFGAHFGDQN